MADYQSLLTRAIANLPNASVATTRQTIYDRARAALVTQLRSLRPPLPDSDIEREERALDNAIAQVEEQFGSTTAPHEALFAAESAPPQPPGASPASPSPGPPAGLKATESPAATPAAAAQRASPGYGGARPQTGTAKFQPAAVARPLQPRPGPTRPPAPAAAPAPRQHPPASATAPAPRQTLPAPGPESGGPYAATLHASPVASAAAARRAAPASGAKPPPVQVARDDRAGANAAPPIVVSRADGGDSAPANLARVVPNAEADQSASAGAPPVIASLADDAEPASIAAVEPVDVERVGSAPRPETEGQRPFAPMATPEKGRSWPWLALAAVLGVVLSIAGAAILMRQKPQDLAIPPPTEAQQEAPQSPAKIAQRAEPSPAESGTSASVSPAPAAGDQQAGQGAPDAGQAAPPAEAQNSPAQLPAAGRAAMLIASADNPQKPVVNLGSTVWSTIPASPGQPASVAVKADADIPDLKMHATMILRKNTDPTLEATHTIDLKFTFADGAPIAGFKDVGLPQMRKLDATASEQLNSVKVKISDVYFLIALAKSDQDLARNVDLIETRAWFDFPLLMNDDRIAKLVFQKSEDGQAMLEKALDAWK